MSPDSVRNSFSHSERASIIMADYNLLFLKIILNDSASWVPNEFANEFSKLSLALSNSIQTVWIEWFPCRVPNEWCSKSHRKVDLSSLNNVQWTRSHLKMASIPNRFISLSIWIKFGHLSKLGYEFCELNSTITEMNVVNEGSLGIYWQTSISEVQWTLFRTEQLLHIDFTDLPDPKFDCLTTVVSTHQNGKRTYQYSNWALIWSNCSCCELRLAFWSDCWTFEYGENEGVFAEVGSSLQLDE